MVDINGYEIKSAFSGGEPLKAIYSLGEKVWPVSGPISFGGLKFTALEDGEIGMHHYGTNATYTIPNLSYSKDGVNWTIWYYSNISVNKGDVICFKGNNDSICKSTSDYSEFYFTNKISSSGNIMSLLYGDYYEGKLSLSGRDYCFYKLFNRCISLTTAPELPATTLSIWCYGEMFNKCYSITTTPKLPTTKLLDFCYYSMFYNCTSLVTAPELPATTLAYGCYKGMFIGCKSLTTAPSVLPATTLTAACYNSMFLNCTSLTTAPELPATKLPSTTLSDSCYANMFGGCSNLNYVKTNLITKPSDNYTYNWLDGVSSTGTFIANQEATWTTSISRGPSTVPAGWTIQK